MEANTNPIGVLPVEQQRQLKVCLRQCDGLKQALLHCLVEAKCSDISHKHFL